MLPKRQRIPPHDSQRHNLRSGILLVVFRAKVAMVRQAFLIRANLPLGFAAD
jgi:hypothetical protein